MWFRSVKFCRKDTVWRFFVCFVPFFFLIFSFFFSYFFIFFLFVFFFHFFFSVFFLFGEVRKFYSNQRNFFVLKPSVKESLYWLFFFSMFSTVFFFLKTADFFSPLEKKIYKLFCVGLEKTKIQVCRFYLKLQKKIENQWS